MDFEEKQQVIWVRALRLDRKLRSLLKRLEGKPRVAEAEMKRLKKNYNPNPRKYYYVKDYSWKAPLFRPRVEQLRKDKQEQYTKRRGEMKKPLLEADTPR